MPNTDAGFSVHIFICTYVWPRNHWWNVIFCLWNVLSSSAFPKCHDGIKHSAALLHLLHRQQADLPNEMLLAIVTAHTSHGKMSGRGKPVETCMLSHWVMPPEIQNTQFRIYQWLTRVLLHAVTDRSYNFQNDKVTLLMWSCFELFFGLHVQCLQRFTIHIYLKFDSCNWAFLCSTFSFFF